MGIYTATFVCFGKFIDIYNADIEYSEKIANLDAIIEKHEWNLKYVKKESLIRCLSQHEQFKSLVDKLILNSNGNDLFLQEVTVSTLDTNYQEISKYIVLI